MSSSQPQINRGFTLLEVMVAMAVLAFALTIITGAASSSATYSKRVYRSTVAALLLRGTILDIEEKYRKDGFPTNDVTGRDCELPKTYAKQFKCNFDILGLNLDDAAIADMTTNANTLLAKAQETMAASGALDKLSGEGGPKKTADLSNAANQAASAGLDLTGMAKGGDLMQLLTVILMSGDAGLNLLQLCDINISVLQMSMGLMIGELLPRVLKRASDRTRKVIVRLSWKDDEGEKRTLEMETFTTAVSQEEAEAIKAMKANEKIQDALDPNGTGALLGLPKIPGLTPGAAGR
ncbi:MAG: type II secretion system protein [Myxococcales bacterium]|nr:type II secretion system protein [Myxococcales bacterium]